MKRTQIYLDEDQKRKLRLLAADRGGNVSDLVRRAVDRLLSDEFRDMSREELFESARTAALASLGGGVTDEEIETAYRVARKKERLRA